jgi:hypothetical protein
MLVGNGLRGPERDGLRVGAYHLVEAAGRHLGALARRRLDRRRLGTIFLRAGQTGHHHVEQLGIDKRQRIA